jgi:DNA-binding transcriptional regulator YiaG/uncharacterized SAM-dependent methyltransferase
LSYKLREKNAYCRHVTSSYRNMSITKFIMSTYFKNTELAERYNISEATVRNWIKSAKIGKNRLKLVEQDGRSYVARNVSNIPTIEELIEQNRKYRNTLAAKTVRPNPRLFDIFSGAHIYDIIRNLELHHEIPHQYEYFDSGVEEWDEYINTRLSVEAPSMLRCTVELLSLSFGYLDKRLAKFDKVNVVDIGVGNAIPSKELIAHLISLGKMGRYIGLDFSQGMLDLAERHLKEWFGDSLFFEGHQLDVAHERFANYLEADYLVPEQNTVNLVLFLGATPNNLRVRNDAFRTICESMNPRDLFIYTDKLEPPGALPEWFEHEIKHGRPELAKSFKLVLELLNIEESFYDVEIGYDERTTQRYARIRFKVAVAIVFDLNDGSKVLSFEKGDAIILWRCWQTTSQSLVELHEENGLYILYSSQNEDHTYALTIAEPNRV